MTMDIEVKTTNFLMVGVGGQGTILASNILAALGVRLGYDVKKAEVHGMSQRGGSVVSHLRWGSRGFAPIVSKGEVDILLAFEELEAARYIEYLRPGGLALVNAYRIRPVTVSNGLAVYPPETDLKTLVDQVTDNAQWVCAEEIAEDLGNPRTANVVLLGALSVLLDMDPALWEEVIQQSLPPKLQQINLLAFRAGRKAL